MSLRDNRAAERQHDREGTDDGGYSRRSRGASALKLIANLGCWRFADQIEPPAGRWQVASRLRCPELIATSAPQCRPVAAIGLRQCVIGGPDADVAVLTTGKNVIVC